MTKKKEFEESERSFGKTVLILIIFAVVAFGIYTFIIAQPFKEKPSYPEPVEVDDSIDPIEQSEVYGAKTLDGKLTSVYFYPQEINFALASHTVLGLRFFDSVAVEEQNSLIIGDRIYFINSFDDKKIELFAFDTIEADEKTVLLSITPGEYLGPVQFETINGENVKYYYYVRQAVGNEGETVYGLTVLLASDSFDLQFGKKLFFAGTDSDLDGTAETKYYVPALVSHGFVPDKPLQGVAHFYIDEDGDGMYDIKIYVDTFTNNMISESISAYPDLVSVSGGSLKEKEVMEEKVLTTNYGSLVVATEGNDIVVRLPE